MKIYTKTGDTGETSLFGGKRVPKDDLRIEAYGTADEVNSWIGLIRDQDIEQMHRDILIEIQDRLFTIGSHLAADPTKKNLKLPPISDVDISKLEGAMDDMDEELPEMRSFVLPGGHPVVSYCHLARCVCRRCERSVIRLGHNEEVDPIIIRYLNRLSDYLFVLGRKLTQELNAGEIPWNPKMK